MWKYCEDSQSLQKREYVLDKFEKAIRLEEDTSDKIPIECQKCFFKKIRKLVKNEFKNTEECVVWKITEWNLI